MKRHNYPYIALALGLTLLSIVLVGERVNSGETAAIPLLTLLIINEFGFFATAIGSYIGFRHIQVIGMQPLYTVITACCLLLSLYFLYMGIELWPSG
ncbi:MAG: hypothetical protein ABW066_15710 [Sedimenticola sp.]